MFRSRQNIFLLCSPELKKGPEGTRHIMSNLARQCLTGLKLLRLPDWRELELTGYGEGHSNRAVTKCCSLGSGDKMSLFFSVSKSGIITV